MFLAIISLAILIVVVGGFAKYARYPFTKSEVDPETKVGRLLNNSIGTIDKGISWVKWAMVGLAVLLAVVAVVAWIWVWLS